MHVFLSMTLIVVKPLSTSIIGNPNSSNKVEYSKVTVSLLLLLEQNLIREKDKQRRIRSISIAKKMGCIILKQVLRKRSALMKLLKKFSNKQQDSIRKTTYIFLHKWVLNQIFRRNKTPVVALNQFNDYDYQYYIQICCF